MLIIKPEHKLQYFMVGIVTLFISMFIKIFNNDNNVSFSEYLKKSKIAITLEKSGIRGFTWGIVATDSKNYKKPLDKIIINNATHEELVSCPGIGSITATKILLDRKKHGKFKSWTDFMDRIPQIATYTIEILKHAGVQLD